MPDAHGVFIVSSIDKAEKFETKGPVNPFELASKLERVAASGSAQFLDENGSGKSLSKPLSKNLPYLVRHGSDSTRTADILQVTNVGKGKIL